MERWPLAAAPHEYNFFQLVHLLEQRIIERHGGASVGGKDPRAERVRLRPSESLAFPAADIAAATVDDQAGAAEVVTTFFGLCGVNSPLPRWYTQKLLWAEAEMDGRPPRERAFLDLFHHRILSLLYRVWRQHRYERSFSFAAPSSGLDRLSRALLDRVGIDPTAPPERLGAAPARLLRHLGLFLLRQRPAEGLRHLLEDELQLPGLLRLPPFPLRYVTLEDDQLSRLRARPTPGGQLGRDLFLGRRRLDRMGLVELHVGPLASGDPPRRLTFRDAERLAPGGADHDRLRALTVLYLRRPLDLRLLIHLPLNEVPAPRLGGARLGGLALCRTAGFQGAALPITDFAGERFPYATFRFEVPLLTTNEARHVPG